MREKLDLPPGWGPVDGEGARALEAELARELGPGHSLAGRPVRALAQHFEDDRALFGLEDGRVACVTLSWGEARESEARESEAAQPATEVFAGLRDWADAVGLTTPAAEFTDTLDLHAFSPRDAESLVRDFLEHWSLHGPREVRIIHGKGIGAMREMVHGVLAGHPAVERFALASDRSGWGATVAVIRPKRW